MKASVCPANPVSPHPNLCSLHSLNTIHYNLFNFLSLIYIFCLLFLFFCYFWSDQQYCILVIRTKTIWRHKLQLQIIRSISVRVYDSVNWFFSFFFIIFHLFWDFLNWKGNCIFYTVHVHYAPCICNFQELLFFARLCADYNWPIGCSHVMLSLSNTIFILCQGNNRCGENKGKFNCLNTRVCLAVHASEGFPFIHPFVLVKRNFLSWSDGRTNDNFDMHVT